MLKTKYLLIIAITLYIFQMIVLAINIDIGYPAADRISTATTNTIVNQVNPANASGKITSIEIWAYAELANCEVATFYVVSGNNLSTRDYESIGTVTSGSKQTFSVDLDVEEGDYLGVYFTAGNIEGDAETVGMWTTGTLNPTEDHIPCTNFEFSVLANWGISLYGTGVTEEEANIMFLFSDF